MNLHFISLPHKPFLIGLWFHEKHFLFEKIQIETIIKSTKELINTEMEFGSKSFTASYF